MDAYDWDKTVFARDTTSSFYFYCCTRYPRLLRFLPVATRIAWRHVRLLPPEPEVKQRFYRFFAEVPDIEEWVRDYWKKNEHLIGSPAMPVNPKPGDVIISASAEFLLRDMCEARGLVLIATLIDPATGDRISPDCFDHEKVRRFRALFGEDAAPETWYSDSPTDTPMADIAGQAFLVKKSGILPWPKRGA